MSENPGKDSRDVLAQDKYFTLRPRPLEQWLWRAGIPASAERVFWLHWQEGMRGDWCSAIALKRVASHCSLDVSTVTRAYQWLIKHGLIRRQDPGRDPTRPFEQAIAITEIRIPPELVRELAIHPDRARPQDRTNSPAPQGDSSADAIPEAELSPANPPLDPFAGLGGRERVRALSGLLDLMSPRERHDYDEALRTQRAALDFDEQTRLTPEQRGKILQLLTIMAHRPAVKREERSAPQAPKVTLRARLTMFDLARLRHQIQATCASADSTELLRQVAWSIQHGALRRFTPLHAMRIALKKIRLGEWTRPHRMPPQWQRFSSSPLVAQQTATLQ